MSYAKGLPVTASEPPSTAECDLTSGLEIQDDAVRRRIRRDGIVGLGETYEQGRWTADRLDDVMCRIFTSPAPHLSPFAWSKLLLTAFDQQDGHVVVGHPGPGIFLDHIHEKGLAVFKGFAVRKSFETQNR